MLIIRIPSKAKPRSTSMLEIRSLNVVGCLKVGDSEAGFATRTKTSSGATSIVFIVFAIILYSKNGNELFSSIDATASEGLDSEHRGIIALTKEQVMHAARTVLVLPNGLTTRLRSLQDGRGSPPALGLLSRRPR
jgi:hypothetical protein